MATRYRIDDFQETYFVVDSLDAVLDLASIDFAPVYDRVRQRDELAPGQILPTDKVLSRGTGAYHG